ncbi:MAG TPA: hypothetical protein VFZ75_05940 [Actinomycetota bacterium]|nr:hypothetical protein [Actinomycetota bacterium]
MPTRGPNVTDEGTARGCARHTCCILAPNVDVEPGFDHLRGEWHLQWVPGDGAWFLAPPKGNVFEIRVAAGEDPVAALEVEGVKLDEVRRAVAGDSLFPPC